MKPIRGWILCASILGSLLPSPAPGADPFYDRLLERGARDLELGLAEEAGKKLRTASFGFLDEPTLLAEVLVQLGRAQVLTGDSSALTDTVLRLVEIEDRFGAYSELDGTLRASFEEALRDALPETLLTRLALFSHLTLAPEAVSNETEPLSSKQQRKNLEQRLVTAPDDAEALLALSQLHSDGGRPKLAARLLDSLLAIEPENQEATCLRAEIAVETKECAAALAGLGSCSPLTSTQRGDLFLLRCLESTGRFEEATAFLEALPADRRQAPKVVRAERKLAASRATEIAGPAAALPEPGLDGATAPAAESAPSEASELSQPPPPQAGADADADAELEQRIERLRRQAKESSFREQLVDTLGLSRALADENPSSTEAQYLAAEVAYLAGEWELVRELFDRTERPSADRPELLFYLAVATYEGGDNELAASILRQALPRLERNAFVDGYVERILQTPDS